jgi:site-specific recombinase XerD
MYIFKRGNKYHYQFQLNGKRYKKSTPFTNRRDAYEFAYREWDKIVRAKHDPAAPTLKEFQAEFLEHVKSMGCTPATLRSYTHTFAVLLEYAPIANARISDISEVTLAAFKQSVLECSQVSKATINRHLSVLRSVLHYAHRQRLITFVPHFDQFKREHRQPYIFSDADYRKWLECSREPLKSMSVLAMGTGMRVGEMLALQKDSVHLLDESDEAGFFGDVEVRTGRKAICRRRTLRLSRELRDTLQTLVSGSECQHVFTSPKDPTKPLAASVLTRQIADARTKGGFAKEASLHALRATFIRKLVEITDLHTAARIAGHRYIGTTVRFISERLDQEVARKVLGCADIQPTRRFYVRSEAATKPQGTLGRLWSTVRDWATKHFVRLMKEGIGENAVEVS